MKKACHHSMLMRAALLAGGCIAAYPALAQTTTYAAGGFTFTLYDNNQSMQSLFSGTDTSFSFTQTDYQFSRTAAGFNHIGDIHLRLRTNGGPWQDFASQMPQGSITPLTSGGSIIAAADITAELGQTLPVQVIRQWLNVDDTLTLRFTITNTSSAPIELGVVGMPIVVSNIFWNRTTEQNDEMSCLAEPYIGGDGGYVQVNRLSGTGTALLILPERGTPLNAYEPLVNNNGSDYAFSDSDTISNFFEGYFDWTVAAKGFADAEWEGGGTPWNTPSSIMLQPGQTRNFGLRFVQSPSIQVVDDTLATQHHPVIVAVPGYVVPSDIDASLFIKSAQPIVSTTVEPAGALTLAAAGRIGGYTKFNVKGFAWGRARVTVAYADGQSQTLAYFVTKPLAAANADLGRFIDKNQWFPGRGDPFGRSPAILTYDDQVKAIVTQDYRTWIAGMSDEGGAGSFIAFAMKQLDNPNPAEVDRLEDLVTTTIANTLQIPSGTQMGAVRKSLFYYQPGAVSYP